jgi:uncharacterized protein with HEPN domain
MSREEAYLQDIISACRLALEYIKDKTKEEFLKDVQCQDAVIRRLEIIGEAARRTPESIRMSIPEVPWKDMVGMRNIVIHEYDGVDLELVWETLRQDIPLILLKLEKRGND